MPSTHLSPRRSSQSLLRISFSALVCAPYTPRATKHDGEPGKPPCTSGTPERGLTLPSRGRPQAGFAHLRPPLMSNVRPHADENTVRGRATFASRNRVPDQQGSPASVVLAGQMQNTRSRLEDHHEYGALLHVLHRLG